MKEKISILRTPLYQHQINNLQFHLSKPKTGDFSDCGTGKSLSALGEFAILYRGKLAKKLLIVCPLSVMESWALEIEKHTYFTYTRLSGNLENKVKLLNENSQIFLTTYDSIPGRRKSTLGVLLERIVESYFDMIIVDEATYIQSFSALRTKALKLLCENIKYSIFLSGTPITNDATKVLTIYELMDGGETFGNNIFRARNKYFMNVGWKFPKWVIRPNMEEEFSKKLYENAVRVKKEECLDLPPKVWIPRFAYASKEQSELYLPISTGILKSIEVEEGKINIKNVLTQMAKLGQIASGFMYTDREPILFYPNPKAQLLKDLLKEIPEEEKVVIYGWWKEDMKLIGCALGDSGFSCVCLYGETPAYLRKEMIEAFQHDKNIKAFVTNPAAGGYGLTLTAASYVIYYSLSFSLIHFQQSQDRIHRVGQNKTCFYYPLFIKGSIDEYIFDSLQKGTKIAASLTDRKLRERLKRNLGEII